MRIEFLSVIPEVFATYLDTSIMGRAKRAQLVSFGVHDLRRWTHDRHRTVDDAPFGGGQGMLMKPAPFFEAVEELKAQSPVSLRTIFLSPHGKPFRQRDARRLACEPGLLLACGRYEGIDERAFSLADEVISLGDFVLSGGELAALCVADAVVRLLPGALGNAQSPVDESFETGLLECAQYTRPSLYRGMGVPEVLLSGDHAKIAAWKKANAMERTLTWRPDLVKSVARQRLGGDDRQSEEVEFHG